MLSQEKASTRAPKGRRDLALQELGEEGLLYDREGALVHILNLTALHAWRLCDGTRTTEQIAMSVAGAFSGADPNSVKTDIEKLLAQFTERGLLEP